MMIGRVILSNRRLFAASAAVTASACVATMPCSSEDDKAPTQLHRIRQWQHLKPVCFCSCEGADTDSRIRKRATVKMANQQQVAVKRNDTRGELSKIRNIKDVMLKRWEKDEEGWRELPARAWPAYQPNPEQLKKIQAQVAHSGCHESTKKSTNVCQSLLFNVATGMVL